MTQKATYYLEKDAHGKAFIKSLHSGVIATHYDNAYPALPYEIAEILCEDLNEINLRNLEQSRKSKRSESVVAQIHTAYLGNELRESLSYCVLSTLLEGNASDINWTFRMPITPHIHWDRLFRISPQPPMFQNELSAVNVLKPLLRSKWIDLPLNYASTVQEIEEGGYGLVSEEIITELNSKMNGLDKVENFAVELLYNFVERFSITLPIMWVSKMISADTFIDLYRVFVFEQSITPRSPKQKEYRKYLFNRMSHLRATIESIRNIGADRII
jgi:hypothetical protein